MNLRYRVDLSHAERAELEGLVRGGCHAARRLRRAQILLAADAGLADETIAVSLSIGVSTVTRTKRRFVEEGLARALTEHPRPGARRKLSGREEALLVATACSAPPEGRARWTLQLLADAVVALTAHAQLSRETVRRRLAENALKPWCRQMWCIPRIDAEYVARMEDVLDLYAEPAPEVPVVCFDETPVQLIAEVRAPLPAAPGRPARQDYEYGRAGTANLLVALDAHRPWRHVRITDSRANGDFAETMRELVDVHLWTPRRTQVVFGSFWHVVGCCHLSGLLSAAERLRACMGVRGPDPHHNRALCLRSVRHWFFRPRLLPTVVPYSPSTTTPPTASDAQR